MWSNCYAVNADRCYNSVYNCVCLRLKLCLPFSETNLFKDIGTIITGITGIWKAHKDRMCSLHGKCCSRIKEYFQEVTVSKSLRANLHMDKRVTLEYSTYFYKQRI